MKKVLIGIIVLIVVIIGGVFVWYKMSYGGTSYYTQITLDGKKVQKTFDNGTKFDEWEYSQSAYDANGNEKKIDFSADHNLRKEAYLKLTYNDKKGVTSWEEVQQKDIPEKAQGKLK